MRHRCSLLLASLAWFSPAFGAGPSVSVNQNALQQLASPKAAPPALPPTPQPPVAHHPAPPPHQPMTHPLRHPIALPLPPAPAPTRAPDPTRSPTPAPGLAPVPPLALNFPSHSATLSAANIAKIRQFAGQKTAATRRITIAATAIGTAQHPGHAYRLAFARGHAVRDSLIKAGVPLTRIIVQSQILRPGSPATDQRAILTLTP
ncbi:MAG TPA: hypothetical protein PK677_00900 [Acidiphilium sp.]|nr:hypothetical protein [Acidiphilium sp.]HQU24514.1 hypothetical protein [Acidiphilium sp.]